MSEEFAMLLAFVLGERQRQRDDAERRAACDPARRAEADRAAAWLIQEKRIRVSRNTGHGYPYLIKHNGQTLRFGEVTLIEMAERLGWVS